MASLQTRPSSGGRTPSMSSLLHQSTRASLRDYATGLLASSSAKPDPVELDPFEPDSTTQDPLLLNPSPHAARPTASSSSPSRLYEPVSGSDAEDGDLDEPASRAAARPDHVDDMLETVGFGTYQRRLLVLAGMGWLADNMWLQAIAAALPRIQDHFGISDQWIGLLPSCMFTGMMIGASAWGSYSDAKGRIPAFNGTLLLAAIFGSLLGFANSFLVLCILVICLGAGIGGSMPTDGTLFLENTPKRLHYLLTGSVISAGLALILFPGRTCLGIENCDLATQNNGWRYLLESCGVITFLMFLARVFMFRLRESPSWLVSVGRHEDAYQVLSQIADVNGTPVDLSSGRVEEGEGVASDSPKISYPPSPSREDLQHDSPQKVEHMLPDTDGRNALFIRLDVLLKPPMRTTTILVWAIWGVAAAAYTLFNAFLPSWLERKEAAHHEQDQIQELQDFLFFTLAGIPGAILGAVLVEMPWLGQRRSMALSTALTVVGVLWFTQADGRLAVVSSIVVVNLAATLAYAVIYSYTPAVFPAAERGTATGIASALSRLAGIMAPLASGLLLAISDNMPLYASMLLFAVGSVCMLLLPYESSPL